MNATNYTTCIQDVCDQFIAVDIADGKDLVVPGPYLLLQVLPSPSRKVVAH